MVEMAVLGLGKWQACPPSSQEGSEEQLKNSKQESHRRMLSINARSDFNGITHRTQSNEVERWHWRGEYGRPANFGISSVQPTKAKK